MLDLIQLSLGDSELRVQPEGRPLSVVVTVRNNRPIIDEFRLHVEGLDASAAVVSPDIVRLFPHTEATASLMLSAAPGALAGTRHFRVVATSSRDTSIESTADATLTVAAAGQVELELRPERVRGRRRVRTRVLLRNQRNAHTPLRLLPTDPQALLRFDMNRAEFVLGPGAGIDVPLQIRAPRPGLTGSGREYEFTVSAFADDAPLAVPLAGATGTVVQMPFAAWLAVVTAAIAAWVVPAFMLLVLAGVGVWYLGAPGAPLPPSQPTSVPVTVPEATGAQPPTSAAEDGGALGRAAAPASSTGALAVAAAPEAAQNRGGTVAPATPAPAAGATVAPTSGPPVIARFGLGAAVGEPSPSVPLDWSVRGASSVTVDENPSTSAQTGQYDEVERRDYNLTASNSAGKTTQSLSVYVLRPPAIDEFSADRTQIEPGQNVYLVWRTSRALRLFLDDAPVDAVQAGSLTLQLSEPHTFTLRAENSAGSVEHTVAVSVVAATPTPTPTPVPTPAVRRT